MTPFSKRQKQLSAVLLYHCLVENMSACGLMRRLMPKSLFRHVDSTSNDISKWTLLQWEQLFEFINKELCSPTEQWNTECRKELLGCIIQTQEKLAARYTKLDEHVIL